MKPILILILGGLSLSAGGVVMLHLGGTNILSLVMWKFAFQSVLTMPVEVVKYAISGPEESLFRGVLVSVGGVGVAASAGVFSLLASVFGSATRAMKRSSRTDTPKRVAKQKAVEEKGRPQKEERRSSSDDTPGKVKAFFSRLKRKSAGGRAAFEDADAMLEDEPEKSGVSVIEKLRAWVLARGSKKKTLVIKSGNDEETIVEIQDEGSFPSELKDWYGSIKGASQNDPVKIQQARDLAAKASKRARGKVTEEDAMNGEFMLRMMDAWASKKNESTHGNPIPIVMSELDGSIEETPFARAIKDVMEEGVESSGDEDEGLVYDDEDDDFIIQDLDDDEIEGAGSEDDILADEGGDFQIPVNVEDDGEIIDDEDVVMTASVSDDLRAIEVARHILAFEDMARGVANFDTNWDEEMSDDLIRKDHIESMFDALEDALSSERDEVEKLSPFDAGEDAREIEWLQDIIQDVAGCRRRVLDAAGVALGDEVGPEGAEDLDLEAEFAIGREESDGDEDEGSGTEFDDVLDGDTAEAVSDQSAEEMPKTEASDPPGDGEVANEEDAQPDENHVPRNVSIGELEEVERSDELIYNWALVAKSAGAAEAKISHSVIAKNGLKRRVIGISHLVAAWRRPDRDDNHRLNILLRFVPEGEWSLVMDDYKEKGIKMVDTRGDFVQVSPEMLKQPEIENGTLLVHFYGPGAPDNTLEETDGVIVTTSTLSVDRVRDKMVG